MFALRPLYVNERRSLAKGFNRKPLVGLTFCFFGSQTRCPAKIRMLFQMVVDFEWPNLQVQISAANFIG